MISSELQRYNEVCCKKAKKGRLVTENRGHVKRKMGHLNHDQTKEKSRNGMKDHWRDQYDLKN